MKGLEQVRRAVMERLEQAGVRALSKMDEAPETRPDAPVAAVAVREGKSGGAGFGSYLGQETDPETGEIRELYGKRLELELAVDIYAPTAESCEGAAMTAAGVLLEGLGAGVRPLEVKWEEPRWDRERELFLCRGSARCRAYFTAAMDDESGTLLDFELKGVVSC